MQLKRTNFEVMTMTLSLDDKVAIVCDITNSFCKKEGIELPEEIQDFIQNPPKFQDGQMEENI